MKTKKRIEELDLLKAFAMIMVVIGHTKSPGNLANMLYIVHVPIFFLASGCTSRADDAYYSFDKMKQFIMKRIMTLYIPFLKYALPIVLLHNLFFNIGLYEHSYTTNEYISQLLRTFLFSIGETEPLLGQLWFIKVLFLAEVYYAVLVYMTHWVKINKWIILIPAFLVSVLLPTDWFPDVMRTNILWPFKAMFLYLVGRILMKKFNYTEIRLNPWTYVCILAIWIIFPVFFQTSFQTCTGLLSVALVCFSIAVSLLLIQFGRIIRYINFDKMYLLLLKIGGGTMSIYCLHELIFKLLSMGYVFVTSGSKEVLRTSCFIDSIHWTIYALTGILIPLLLNKVVFQKISSYIQR